jgi:hypothetical protein
MMRDSHLGSVKAFVGLAFVLALLAAATPTRAADPVFPPGSRVGLVPPAGMVASETFDGFADPSREAAVLITVLPAAAYQQIEKTLDLAALRKQGVNLEKREPLQLGFGKGILLTGRQVAAKSHYRKWLLLAGTDDITALVTVQVPEQDNNTYPERVVREALTTLAVRTNVPDSEQLSLLPFSVGDLAGFHIDNVLRGRALMLSDAAAGPKDSAKEAAEDGNAAHMLIAAIPGGPNQPEDHANFAKLSFNEIGGIRNVNTMVSEPLRVGGQSGFQTMAEAKDARTGAAVMVVQWLRFGGGGYLQMIGMARADNWTAVLARLRTVRDSVDLR